MFTVGTDINTLLYGMFLSSVIKNHALLHVAAAYADLLTDDIILLKKNLSIAKFGVYEKLPRWKRCLSATDSGLGMALGGMFVKKAFAQKSKTEVGIAFKSRNVDGKKIWQNSKENNAGI